MDSYLELHYRLLERLEKIARHLLEVKIHSLQDLWQFEIELVKFQSEQQQAVIAERKTRQEVNNELKKLCLTKPLGWEAQRQQYQNELQQSETRLNIYDHAYNISRKLGDTLAWIFLDRIQITSRAQSASINSSDGHRVPEKHGLQGMLAIAEMLYKVGAGIPLLHDITNCLRVGDITFVHPGKKPLTIEVKTQFKGYKDERIILAIKIYCASTRDDDERWNTILAHIPQQIDISQNIEIDGHLAVQQSTVLEKRLIRQLERMGQTTAWDTALDGTFFKLGKQHEGIILHLSSEKSMHHYDILQELSHDAKSKGFAWRAVDDAFVYTAIYEATPLWLQDTDQILQILLKSDVEDYKDSYISIALPEGNKNQLWIYDTYNNPSFVHPFFLYPLPPELIIDMMWGRLKIITAINFGKLVAALQRVGLNTRLPKNKKEADDIFLPLSIEIPLSDEKSLYGDFSNLQYYGAQIIHEFLSLQGFVNLISHMATSTMERAKNKEVCEVVLSEEREEIDTLAFDSKVDSKTDEEQ